MADLLRPPEIWSIFIQRRMGPDFVVIRSVNCCDVADLLEMGACAGHLQSRLDLENAPSGANRRIRAKPIRRQFC